MRTLDVKIDVKAIASALLLILGGGCSPKPSTATLPDQIHLTPPANSVPTATAAPLGLWFATSNFSSGGRLGRLDLSNGQINRTVLAIAPDAQIFSDGATGLFLLTRMTQDGLTLLTGADARVTAHHALVEHSNPQMAARDALGHVWITSQESNHVLILSADLQTQIGEVDLSTLREANDPAALADLAQAIPLDAHHMLITAQRLHRGVTGWKPDAQGGIAIINVDTFAIENSHLVDVCNPIQAVSNGQQTLVIGGGDLSGATGLNGRAAHFADVQLSSQASDAFAGKILAADVTDPLQAPALVVWYPAEMKSCLQLGTQQVVCAGSAADQGYAFNAIRHDAGHIYASYIGGNSAELWIVNLSAPTPALLSPFASTVNPVTRVPLDMPIQSLSFGP